MKIKSILFFLILFGSITVRSQNFAVKSNLLSLANGALNGGIEYAFGMRSTIDFSGSLRPWKRTERYVERYWLLQAEYRYWTCQKFNGSFFGVFLNGWERYVIGKIQVVEKSPLLRLVDRRRYLLRVPPHFESTLEFGDFFRDWLRVYPLR